MHTKQGDLRMDDAVNENVEYDTLYNVGDRLRLIYLSI